MPAWPVNLPRPTISQGLAAVFGIGWAVTAFTTYADLRIEGPFGIGVGFEGWKPKSERMEAERDEARADLDKVKAAQIEAAAKARAARLEREAEQRKHKEQADAREEAMQAEWRDAAERFIAANSVRPQASRGVSRRTGAASPPASTESPDRRDQMPELADGLVLVTSEDVRICTENTVRVFVAKEWAEGLDDITNGEVQ